MPSDEYRRLAAQLAGIRSAKSGYERFRPLLGPEQLALCEDDSPQIAAHPGRRAGKTTAILGKALRAFAKRPGANVFYFAPTDDQGVGIVWDDLLKYNHRFKLGLEPRKSDGAFTCGASRFEIFGFYHQKDVERARGRKCDLAIVDECFPAGTLVDGRPIETISRGDVVTCVDHVTGRLTRRRVIGTSKKIAAGLVTISVAGVVISSTPNHPVFVKGKGYVNADAVEVSDLLCVRSGLHVRDEEASKDPSDVLGYVFPGEPAASATREQSNVEPRASREDARDYPEDRPQAECARREREGSDGSGNGSLECDRMEDRGSREDRSLSKRWVGISDLLQAGCGGRIDDDVYRGRWSEPSSDRAQGTGCEEDGVLEWRRVESVSRVEPRGSAGTAVYNLEVEGAHTYFANGVLVHNCQLGPDWFGYFLSDVLAPSLLDYLGQMVLIGTPGPAADGVFFEACNSPDWSNLHHWTCAQNPFFAGRDPLREARERHHLAEDSITYKREWLGQWIVDPDALVYAIPDSALIAKPGPWFSSVYGLDLGWNDHDAISRVDVDHLREFSVLSHMETASKQTNHQLFRRLMDLQAQRPGPVVFDPAGHATRKTIETFAVDAPKIVWVMAEKARKVEFIQLLNDDMREGKHYVDPACTIMTKEARRLRWKRPGKLATDAQHSDPGDAWLYSHRYARDQLRELPKVEPKTTAESPYDAAMAKMKAEEARGGVMRGRAAQKRREAFS